jgi:hypothetical protein
MAEEDRGNFIINMLKRAPFFKRFDTATLRKYLGYAKPEYYNKGDIVFTDNRIGIICHGSVRIKTHSDNIL